MMIRHSIVGLAIAAAFAAPAVADDIEVLARGPVHEAYAEPSEREPKPTPVVPKEPPKPIEELPPDQKPEGDNVQWLPGYWAWDEEKTDFLWVSGFWRVAPPGRSWVPGSWQRAGDGWQWAGGFWAEPKAGKAEVEYLPPPPVPLDQAGPTTPAPSDNHTYVTGSWVYRERYVWRPGFWIEHRPNWVWTSAHYRWTPAGCVFIDGYWDYPLASRGVLFAPAYIPPAVYASPTFVYTPTVVVREECLYGAFFARRGYGSYYFGDYFAPRYAGFGFTAWSGHVSASVSIGGWHDPLFSYYRCGNRHDPYWRGGVVDLYVGRYRGDYARPPVTLVQQTTVINNITNNKTVIKNTNVNNVQMLTSIRDQKKVGNLNIQKVSDSVVRGDAANAREVRAAGTRRVEQESRLAVAARPGRPAGPQRATLDVPNRPNPAVERPRPGSANPTPVAPRPTPAGTADRKLPPTSAPKGDTGPAVGPKPAAPRPSIAPPKAEARPTIKPDPVVSRPAPPKAEAKGPRVESPPRIAPRPDPIPEPRREPKAVVPAPRIEPKPVPAPAPPKEPKPAPRPVRPESKSAPDKKDKGGKPTAIQSPARPPLHTAAKPAVSPAPARRAPAAAPAVRPAARAATVTPRVAPRPQPAARPAAKAPTVAPRAAPPRPAPRAQPAPRTAPKAVAPKPAARTAPKAVAPKPAAGKSASKDAKKKKS